MKKKQAGGQPQRRTISSRQVSKIDFIDPQPQVKIVHADEWSVWTRFASTFGKKLLCTMERLDCTDEVAFIEGWRELNTQNRLARAAYSIEWLYNGEFFVSVQVEYKTGDYSGSYTHEVFSSRQECVEYFLERARRHFGSDRTMPDGQREAQRQMQALLEPTLFGFIEPAPAP